MMLAKGPTEEKEAIVFQIASCYLGTSWVSLIPLAPLSLVGFYM